MNFATPAFFAFLLVVTSLVYALKSPRARQYVILIASYVFYASWNCLFIALILLSTSIDYFLSKKIAQASKQQHRQVLLGLGIGLNLVILGIFKYFNFFVDNADYLFSLINQPRPLAHLNLILPLGISFYTFEAISYLVDVYRGDQPASNFREYNFYIMYFPHLISGPIVRYRELEKQIREGLWMPTTERVLKAFELIVLGLVFKVIIADTASGLVDPVFANVGASTATQIWLAWAGFTTQIYFDFMGYTHIARGVSLLFNIELPLNFDHPYNAPNISNFWQRWHITLSRWIRDYLFIPLGGSRATQLRTATNLLLTMTIAGAWHGAAWTFIIWGAYHGLLLLLYHITKAVRQSFAATIARSAIGNKSYSAICTTLTFLAVSFGWIWFRSPDCQTGVNFVGKLFRFGSLYREVSAHLGVGDFEFIITFATLILCCTLGPWLVRVTDAIRIEVPYWIKVQVATAAMVLCYIFAGAASKPFIYFQF